MYPCTNTHHINTFAQPCMHLLTCAHTITLMHAQKYTNTHHLMHRQMIQTYIILLYTKYRGRRLYPCKTHARGGSDPLTEAAEDIGDSKDYRGCRGCSGKVAEEVEHGVATDDVWGHGEGKHGQGGSTMEARRRLGRGQCR